MIFLCYTIQFSTINRFESSDIVIHDIDLIRYHRDGIHPIEFRGERFIISYGIKSRIIVK
jgi:hypothetical protein